MLTLYWEIGNSILEKQNQNGWGSKVIDLLAIDLAKNFPDNSGFSVRNLKYMRAFAEAYPILSFQLCKCCLHNLKMNLCKCRLHK
jgi:hypothetical protein